MKDSDIRGLVLQAFYERRDEPLPFRPEPEHFNGRLTALQIFRICQQLEEQGLIKGAIKPMYGGEGGGVVLAKVTSFGADVIEGEAKAAIAIHVMNTSYNINNSTNVAIGDNNQLQQTVVHSITELVRVIESADAPVEAKEEAKGMLRQFLEHPLLAAALGAAAPSLLALLKA